MSPELREHWLGEPDHGGYEVWHDNWRAFDLFCFCATQWQFSESGVRLGLNYTAVQAVLHMHRIPPRQHAGLMADIRLIELGAIDELARLARQTGNS